MDFIEAGQHGSFTSAEQGGPHWTYRFDNGYGASVIIRPYGGFEIAVLDKDDSIVYDTPVTDNVRFANSFAAVDVILEAIYDLPPAQYMPISTRMLKEWREVLKNAEQEITTYREAEFGNKVAPCYTIEDTVKEITTQLGKAITFPNPSIIE